ncbi:MAG: hypothetical protein AB7G47_20995, partial [Mycolicibacterium sp.]|uniref:hypothetical protein n=1 Tax=Mycolicibacterium sp. TaxID=2320850 RepID=UPI003D0AA192
TKTPKPASKKTSTPKTGKQGQTKKQQTKTTKHTIEFSNNTPVSGRATNPRHMPRDNSADGQEPTEMGTSL